MKTMMSVIGMMAMLMLTVGIVQNCAAEEHEHGKKGEMKMPETYAAAVKEIQHHSEAIDKAIKDGKLDTLHTHGEEVKMLALMLPKLASKADSGVAQTDIKEINLTSKALAAKYEPLDEAGDAGKKAESQKVYDEMLPLIATLKKFAK